MSDNVLRISMPITIVLPSELLKFDSQICSRNSNPQVRSLFSSLFQFGIEHIHIPACGPCLAALQEIRTNRVLAVGASTQISPINWLSAERLTIQRYLIKTSSEHLPTGLRLVTTADLNERDFEYIQASGLTEVISSCRRNDVKRYTGFSSPPLRRNWKRKLSSVGCTATSNVQRSEGLELLRAYQERFC